MKTKKSRSAITLVALIITIIILLILATVSISLVINNGVLDKAQNGVDKYSEEEELEQIKLAVASAMLKGNGFLDTDNLNGELHERIDENENAEKRENTWYYKEYIIDESGKVEKYDRLLPREFRQVEYIESTGTQWIDTYVNANYNLSVKMEFEPSLIKSDYSGYFGARTSMHNESFCIWVNGSNFRFDYDNRTYNVGGGLEKDNKYILSWNKNQIYFNDILKTSLNLSEFSSMKTITVFALKSANSIDERQGNYKLYSLTIGNSEGMLRNFIPCYCTTTVTNVDGDECDSGTIGLYDTVEGKFYTNKGSGTFLKGNNV